ncbi:MAG: sensor histidine kinase [Lacunisphaera sp.]|nr:sensor histidine kinase [Lacunisphaera sp.]
MALRAQLRKTGPGNGDRAQGLGRAALASGLATLDFARIHDQAVVTLAASRNFANTRGSIARIGYFFAQALIPLEAAHLATRKTNRRLQQRNAMLRAHTAELARGNRRLKREIKRRKAGEETIRQSSQRYQQLFLESQVMHRKLRQLTRQVFSAQEEERKQLSRELHDGVVQTLVGINVELSALLNGPSIDLHNLKAKITRTRRMVAKSVNTVHRFARELRPAVLDDLGLIPALHAYCKNFTARKKIIINLTAFSGVEALDISRRAVIYRVAQEALTNIARHAHATRVSVSLSGAPHAICLEIKDNGRSFSVEKTLRAKTFKRLGLIGMKERVEMVNGVLTIESAPGQGTTVRAAIPFHPAPVQP